MIFLLFILYLIQALKNLVIKIKKWGKSILSKKDNDIVWKFYKNKNFIIRFFSIETESKHTANDG